jgi:pilus assembly protein CpaC
VSTASQAAGGSAASPVAESALPQALLLVPGQIQTIAVAEVKRVAIGNPDIADVTVVSPSQILVQAKKVGSTNLILWEAGGQRQAPVTVVDPQPEAVSEQLRQLLHQLNFPSVEVRLQGGKVFLVGEVDSEPQLSSLEQMASAFQGVVVNLVTVKPAPPPTVETAPLVKLAVQVIELNRTDLEKLGVKWAETLALTEQCLVGLAAASALLRWED